MEDVVHAHRGAGGHARKEIVEVPAREPGAVRGVDEQVVGAKVVDAQVVDQPTATPTLAADLGWIRCDENVESGLSYRN
ncbi:hypothetical protein HC031_22965 [Planosporangium thailandense]|uniref:Uncharacterized protein n=1 Tax=Planosporangium thailandense TaxID=765197 RepID=A0ABX0Y2G3_9ACTN|nr:hypothetical protein [Planosporangium thailandense]NJC72557.1 hypothetical protein [Planosporangium thailandense]